MEEFGGKGKREIWKKMISFVWIILLEKQEFGRKGNRGTNVPNLLITKSFQKRKYLEKK